MFCAILEFSVTVFFGWKAVEMKSLLKRSEKGEVKSRREEKSSDFPPPYLFLLPSHLFLLPSFCLSFYHANPKNIKNPKKQRSLSA